MASESRVSFLSGGKRIAGVFRLPQPVRGRAPCVVINHGYSGYKEEYDDCAAALNTAGFATLQFDSRGCGASEAPLGRMMASEWADDADAAVSWTCAQPSVDPERIGFTGCSLGGVMSLYAAGHDRRVRSVVEMSAFFDGRVQLEEAWVGRRGAPAWNEFLAELEADAARVVQGGPSRMMSVPDALAMCKADASQYMSDRLGKPGLVIEVPLESVRSAILNFRPLLWLGKIEIPVMVMHGTADEIVPPRHAELIHEALRSRKELVKIPGGPHPLPLSDCKGEVFRHMVRWFVETLHS